MHLTISPLTVILLLLSLVHPSLSAKTTATSFCKCVCFNNSTIIALNPPSSSSPASRHQADIRSPNANADPLYTYPKLDGKATAAENTSRSSSSPSRPHHKLTCADCTRAFCLDYNLPICKDAREEDVFTTCFQRDSVKDETVVVIFIFATAGLLAWAVVKPWVDRLRERSSFAPLSQHADHPPTGAAGAGQTRRGGFGPRTGDGPGRGGGPGGRGRGRESARGSVAGFSTSPTDIHADHDAADIVSGSGSRS